MKLSYILIKKTIMFKYMKVSFYIKGWMLAVPHVQSNRKKAISIWNLENIMLMTNSWVKDRVNELN